jgi:HEPN domain-containing protein
MQGELDRLLRVLATQIERHEALRDCIARQREAIRCADIDAMTRVCEEEHAVARSIGDAEKERLALVGRVTASVRPQAAEPLTLAEIAALGDPPRCRGLEELAGRLREVIELVRHEASVVRAAADTLSGHVSGILQTVYGALSAAPVYEQRGRLSVGNQIDHCVDIKS